LVLGYIEIETDLDSLDWPGFSCAVIAAASKGPMDQPLT
jgi:hypothetical protein